MLVEACVDSLESAVAAQAGGAGRVELCDNLAEGGTTPSAGTIAVCREQLEIPVFVLIRARGGDFLYSAAEVEAMARDILVCRELGVDGVVVGALTADGEVDAGVTRLLVDTARPMQITFHRAFDWSQDATAALDVIAGLGIERVLTSGQARTALEGAATIRGLADRAAGRVTLLAGGGIDESNVVELVRASGVTEVHVRGATPRPSAMRCRNEQVSFTRAPAPDGTRVITDAGRIRRLVTLAAGAG